MSVATELQRIIDAKADLKTAIENKGVTVSSSALIDDYPALVDAIPTGGKEEKVLNFYDFDGTLVESYANNEIQSLTALPSAPDHSSDDVPLTFDEWNWTLAQIKTYNTNHPNGVIQVGANYHTTDGKGHYIFKIEENDLLGVSVRSGGSGTINWGDGTTESISSGTFTHVYQNAGVYDCSVDRKINVGGSSSTIKATATKLIKVRLQRDWDPNENYLFAYCNNLEDISLPKGLTTTSFAQNNFKGCSSLKCLIIPSNIQYFTNDNIAECNSLKIVSYSPSNTTIGSIQGTYIERVSIPDDIPLNNAIANNCQFLKEITLPNTLITIMNNSFQQCFLLRSLTIPSSVTEIRSNAFYWCSGLTSLTIPANVTTIADSAFSYTYGLSTLTMLPTTPPTMSGTPTTPGFKKIYVPYSADHSVLAAYKTATNWSNFATIMEELPE